MAAVVIAFVNGAELLLFPKVQGIAAMRAPVLSFSFAETFGNLKQSATDFTEDLLAALAIVEVKEL